MNVSVSNSINLGVANGATFHYRRKFEPAGRHPIATVPQFSQCCIARILHGSWLLSTIEGDATQCEVEFRAPESHNFIVLELSKNEKLAFDFRYFVGFAGGLKMHTQLSLNVAGLALPR